MTQVIDSIDAVADQFDAIVFDQWGVLHDGTSPYDGVPDAVAALARTHVLGVLSNSGKRAAENAARIARMGYDTCLFHTIMTSGEAYWQACATQTDPGPLLAITAAPGDARIWAAGLDLTFADDVGGAAAILLMGLPEWSDGTAESRMLDAAFDRGLPMVCTNPDRVSPRADRRQVGPGALAHAYADRGGDVTFYGKPHRPVFDALARALDVRPDRILMVGDSLEHDIAGAFDAGWQTLFVQGGLAVADFASGPARPTLARLAGDAPMPDYTLFHVR